MQKLYRKKRPDKEFLDEGSMMKEPEEEPDITMDDVYVAM